MNQWTSGNFLIQLSSGGVPVEVIFFAVKSFDANIAISGNFVITGKNSNPINLVFNNGATKREIWCLLL